MHEAIAIVGPTACGKTRRAVEIASRFGGEIISCDSRQVYRSMNLGTGKDLEEYGTVPYHLIDIADAGEKYNLFRFIKDCDRALQEIKWHGNLPILCGGTGLYVESILSGIRMPTVPENEALRKKLQNHSLSELEAILRQYRALHNVTDTDTPKRAIRAIEIEEYYRTHPEEAALAKKTHAKPLDALIIGIDIDRDSRRHNITRRLHQRLSQGMIDEVDALLKKGVTPDDLIYYGLEYKFVTLYLIGELSRDEMTQGLEIAIHQFAKRQMTWLRGMQRRGFNIHWLPWDMTTEKFLQSVTKLLHES